MFRAILVELDETGVHAALRELDDDSLPDGNVTVAVEYSTLNYKDGLALRGKNKVVRRYPMVPGVDFSGVVEDSTDDRFAKGDRVVLNGWDVGENHWGGFAEKARVSGDWLVPIPPSLSTRDAMAIGTAGLTAMLAVMALEDHDITPERGPVVVTGAAGGVGSIAVLVLAHLGYEVIAVTGRPQEGTYLQTLGASAILDRREFAGPARPLAKGRWIGGVDCVGSHTLANVLASTQYGGTVAACGLAHGIDLPSSVAPFILRGVTLAGINSTFCPTERRRQAWIRLASDVELAKLGEVAHEVALAEVLPLADEILAGSVRGRVVVNTRS